METTMSIYSLVWLGSILEREISWIITCSNNNFYALIFTTKQERLESKSAQINFTTTHT